MKTLKLFNAVLAKESSEKPFISSEGFIILPNALYAKNDIEKYWSFEQLNGNDLNKTFHKSWKKILNSSREELLIHQIIHYISTYGTDFGEYIYIPNEILNVPEVEVSFKIFKGYSKEELINKSLNMIKSGIALKEETIDDILDILDELKYTFKSIEDIKNKEAVIKICDKYGILPEKTVEVLRYIIFKMTGETLLIKNDEIITKIKNSTFNPSIILNKHGLTKFAEIFNRFKPLFLAMKSKNHSIINKISKLSKEHHKPLVQNPLNTATQKLIGYACGDWFDNATPYALFKTYSALHQRFHGQSNFIYRIRNGKSWYKKTNNRGAGYVKNVETNPILNNYLSLQKYLKRRFDFSDKIFYIPENICYAIPTSEKMFVGNIPIGTKIFGKSLAVGVYWENEWGAMDIDISGINIGGKVGWNSTYNQNSGNLMYSGDITNAPKGAVEYLYIDKNLSSPTLVMGNIFYGQNNSGYKIIVGDSDNINIDYMMNPNNLLLEVKTNSVQKQMIIGMMFPEKEGVSFVVLNVASGNYNVSGKGEKSIITINALYQQWKNALMLEDVLKMLGGKITRDKKECNIDLSLETLEKDSIMKIFQ